MNVSEWSTTAINNSSAPPDGWPEGQAPSTVNNCAREMMAALAKWFQDQRGGLTAGGSANALTLTTNNVNTALNDVGVLVFRAAAANTGAATLNVDALGAKSIKKSHDQDLTAGDIEANMLCMVAYNASDDTFELLNPPATTARGLLAVQVFGATGSQTYNRTAGTVRALVRVQAGGGAGGGSASTGSGQAASGGGGGAGGYAEKLVTPGATETVVVGAGGTGGAGSTGNSGGTSSFGSHVSATGGVGGSPGAANSQGAFGGSAGNGVGGDMNITGGQGGIGSLDLFTGPIATSGGGGASFFGGGARALLSSGPFTGLTGTARGSGGSGGGAGQNSSAQAGGAGAPGIVIVWEFG